MDDERADSGACRRDDRDPPTTNPFAAGNAQVRYTDLDLSRPDDQLRLRVRLDRAAGEVCGRGADRLHPMLAAQAAQCKHDVIAETRARIEQRIAANAVPVRAAAAGGGHSALK